MNDMIKAVTKGGMVMAMIFMAACQPKEQIATTEKDYPIQPVDIRSVKLTDEFWLPIVKTVQEKTIEYALLKCQEEGRFDNFLIAGKQMTGEVKGQMPFDDTDIYKIIEGASNTLISSPNPQLEQLLDSLIGIVAIGQEADGYLTTWRTINPAKPPAPWVKVVEGKRWESLAMSHEFYNVGHMYEAAAVHFQATGKRNFLDIALKNADLIVNTFGKGKIEAVPGHQIIETGLVKLYRVTGKTEYLKMAKYFLDSRGDHTTGRESLGAYCQDHQLVTDQQEVVGHAVRAVYMYAGMTDIAALYDDAAYRHAIDTLWDNMVSKKMYITGGIGARHDGEAFGENYELPNLTAYNETCAAIGDVYWNHRLFMLSGDKKYYDIIERSLYNGLISGLSLDGKQFFYPNALESDGIYPFNRGACTRQGWFDCSCCPTNLIRFLPAVAGLIYAKDNNNLFVNLYAGNEAQVIIKDQNIHLSQQTNYPWDGLVNLSIETEKPVEFALRLRLPGWALGQVIPSNLYSFQNVVKSDIRVSINGEPAQGKVENGYYVISQIWDGSATVTLNMPMSVQTIQTNEKVIENKGLVSLEYGPLVYAVESIDNASQFENVGLTGNESYTMEMNKDLLKGVNVMHVHNDQVDFDAIPYYAWSNRGIGKMKVWLPSKNDGAINVK